MDVFVHAGEWHCLEFKSTWILVVGNPIKYSMEHGKRVPS